MRVIRDLTKAEHIPHPEIRCLVLERIHELGADAFDAQALGYFMVVEEGDSLDTLNAQVGFNLLCNRSSGIRFDAPGFFPSFEFIEEFPDCYDLVFVISDDGYGIEIFVPKGPGSPVDVIAMCQQHSFRADP